jgi:hypothetical protein
MLALAAVLLQAPQYRLEANKTTQCRPEVNKAALA